MSTPERGHADVDWQAVARQNKEIADHWRAQAMASVRPLPESPTANPAESAPRPVIDREALEISARNKIAEWYGTEWNASEDKFYETYDGGGLSCVDDEAMLELRGVRLALDRVVELARPMPTREQIDAAVQETFGRFEFTGQNDDWGRLAVATRNAVLALISGSES